MKWDIDAVLRRLLGDCPNCSGGGKIPIRGHNFHFMKQGKPSAPCAECKGSGYRLNRRMGVLNAA